MAKFDTKTMYDFEKYLELQRSGELNMVSPEVREKLGITKDEHHYILEHYSELLDEYEEFKKVDELIEDAVARSEGDKEKGLSPALEIDLTEDNKEY